MPASAVTVQKITSLDAFKAKFHNIGPLHEARMINGALVFKNQPIKVWDPSIYSIVWLFITYSSYYSLSLLHLCIFF